MRDDKGNIVGWFSPILDASGAERDVKAGAKYVFLSRGVSADGALLVFRIEPLSNETKVRALLTPADATAAPPPSAAPLPLPSAPASVPARGPSLTPPPRARSGCALAAGTGTNATSAALLALVAALLVTRRGARENAPTATRTQ